MCVCAAVMRILVNKSQNNTVMNKQCLLACVCYLCYIYYIILPYPRERGPMGGAPYIGPRLGDGPIFEVSVSHLYAKERPGKLPTLAS